jgi:hypothetical protein
MTSQSLVVDIPDNAAARTAILKFTGKSSEEHHILIKELDIHRKKLGITFCIGKNL